MSEIRLVAMSAERVRLDPPERRLGARSYAAAVARAEALAVEGGFADAKDLARRILAASDGMDDDR